MNAGEALLKAMGQHGAADGGAVPIACLLGHMSPQAQAHMQAQAPWAQSLFCGVFPYFKDRAEGNLSLYARGLDYHQVLQRRLERACQGWHEAFPSVQCRIWVDASPFPEVYAAALCGLGLLGCQGLLLTPDYGSYVFIGTVATSLAVPQPKKPIETCEQCGACVRACPGGALQADGKVDTERCLSALTQQKGELTPWQRQLIAACGSAWGCDRCQLVCPHNQKARQTYLPEFLQDTLTQLQGEQFAGMSNRAFRRQYAHRAFSWRGVGPLQRNLMLLGKTGKEEKV